MVYFTLNFTKFFYLVNFMRMSLQTKPLVGKEISSLSLGYASALGRNTFANLGLGLQRYIAVTLRHVKNVIHNRNFSIYM